MSKLIIMCGISGSGKSTKAKELWGKDPLNVVIINRDKIRELLFGFTEENIQEYYKRDDINKLEKQVTKYEDTLIYDSLESNKTVIVDATHLTRKYLERFKYWNVETEVVFSNVLLKEAEVRNESRIRKVPNEILRKQYNRYINLQKGLENNPIDFTPVSLNKDISKPYCYVFDIDGTLAEKGDRSPYDWKEVGKDTPIENIVDILNDINSNNEWQVFSPIYICTGRDEVCRKETIGWLDENVYNSQHFTVLMRSENDNRPDWIVKQEMLKEINKTNYVEAWFDDRMQVTRHLRMLGVKVLNVEHNNF